MIEVILSFLGALAAIIGIFLNYISGVQKATKNDIRHIHARIDELVGEVSDLKERIAKAEESIRQIDKKVNNAEAKR